MNTKSLFSAIVALLAVSCAKEQPLTEKQAGDLEVTASVEQPGPDTRTTLEGLSVKWTAGDKIYLVSADGTQKAIYKAETSASATSFVRVSGATSLSGDIYAYYPADNVTGFSGGTFTAEIPAVQAYVAGGFADGVNPMTAKGTVSNGTLKLDFKNVLSFVKVQISDNVSEKLLTGVSLTSSAADLSGTAAVSVGADGKSSMSLASGSKSIKINGILAGLSSAAVPVYFAVPAATLGKLTISADTSEPTGEYNQEKVSSATLTAERNSVHSYNTMAISSFTDKTPVPSAPANCYMVDASRTAITIPLSQAIAGWDAIKAIEPDDTFDKSKITSGSRMIDVRWYTKATGTISLTDIDDANMTLSLSATNGSNAVVDLKNGSEVVWSWHLWFTDYKPAADNAGTKNGQVFSFSGPAFKAGGRYYGKVVMDRNLGATVTGFTAETTLPPSSNAGFGGLYYQYGRKEPFTSSVGTTYKTTTLGKVTYAYAAQHPSTFFLAAHNTAWTKTDSLRTKENPTDLWNSNGPKSAFDPCPAGWRVPKNGSNNNENIWSGITGDTFYESGAVRGQYWEGTWIPTAGAVRCSDGGYYGGNIAYFWNAGIFNATSAYMSLFSKDSTIPGYASSASRASGYNIRCVRE